MWTFNLTVPECDDGQSFDFLWHEGITGRRANEVGFCLYSYLLKDVNPKIKNIIMYSDTCGSQNRNSHIAAMCIVALKHSETLQVIDHKSLVPGHTHMECDTDHSLIERKRKHFIGNIEHPHDWAQLIRLAGKKKPFIVKEITKYSFFDFAGLLKKELQLHKVDEDGNRVNWREIKWLRYDKNKPDIVYYKRNLDEIDFKTMSFRRRGRSDIKLVPQLKYTEPTKITKEKKKNLMDLLAFISPVFHQFYKDLETSNSARNVHPDTIEEDNENNNEQCQ